MGDLEEEGVGRLEVEVGGGMEGPVVEGKNQHQEDQDCRKS